MELALMDDSSPHHHPGDPDLLPCTVPAAPGSRLSFSWGAGCQMHVAEVVCPSTQAGGQQPYAGSLEWGSVTPAQRGIAFKVLPLYSELQQQLLLARDGGMQQDVQQARQAFSDAVLDVLMGKHGLPGNDEQLQVAYEAALWQLLDFFFLSYEDLNRGVFPEAFAGWMLQHGSLFDADTPGTSQLHAQAAELMQDPRVDTNTAYWSTVQRLVLLGQLETAMTLLAHHPVAQAGQDEGMANLARGFDEVYQLLRTVPRLGRQTGSASVMLCAGGLLTDNVVQYGQERAQWEHRVAELWHHRGELLEELKESDTAAAKGLAALLQMLCVEDNTIHPDQSRACKQMAKVSWNWVELLTGLLLWQHRSMPLEGLQMLPDAAVGNQRHTRHTDRDFLDFFQQLFAALCRQEVQEVIRLCSSGSYTSLQFVIHSFEVLKGLPAAAGVILRPLAHMGCDQAEVFTLNYVDALAGSRSTWQLGAEYLAWCPVYGADGLESLLDRSQYPLLDLHSAHKALALARRHDLTAAAYSLAKRLAAVSCQNGQLASALQWGLQAQDPQLCAEMVAPVIAKVQQQLLSQVGRFQASPLDLPELSDLEPLLLNLPGSSTADAAAAAAADGGGGGGEAGAAIGTEPQAQQRLQRYPELQFLRAMLQLQQALQEVHSCQQPVQVQAQVLLGQQGSKGDSSMLMSDLSQQQGTLLRGAYAALRQPVQDLLLEGLAPAALRLPLLLLIAPLLESAYMPFSRSEVQGLLRLMVSISTGLPAVAASVLDGSHGNLPGISWPTALSDKAGPDAAAVNAARLALCRGLSRAHVVEQGVQAW